MAMKKVGEAYALAGTDGGFTMAVFEGKEVPPGTPIYIYQAPEKKCSVCGTTENLHEDLGSGGPWKCSSLDCVAF